jgi:hypothetical protein
MSQQLSELKKSISEMTDEELLEVIRGTRDTRRQMPEKKRNENAEAGKQKKQKSSYSDLFNLLASLSPEERAGILEQLGDVPDVPEETTQQEDDDEQRLREEFGE